MECLVALVALVWEIARAPRRRSSDFANMLLPGEMSSQELLVSKHFIAVAAMVAQGFLVGVLSTAVTAVMWSRMHNTSCMREVLSKIREVNITPATIAMFCNLSMVLQFCQTKKSFFTLLTLWMLLPIMLEHCLFLGELEAATETTK
jgi:hypothetical protein